MVAQEDDVKLFRFVWVNLKRNERSENMRVADKLREKSGQLGTLIREIVNTCDAVAGEGQNSVVMKLDLGGNLNTSKAIAAWAQREGFTKCVFDVTHQTLELAW